MDSCDVVYERMNRAPGGQPAILRSRAGAGALDNETVQLIECFLGEYAGLAHLQSDSEALSTMKRVVAEILTTHACAYNGRCRDCDK